MEMLVTMGAFAVIMLAMALGVMLSGKALRGSCGGAGDSCACADTGDPNACKTEDSEKAQLTAPQQASHINVTNINASGSNRNSLGNDKAITDEDEDDMPEHDKTITASI